MANTSIKNAFARFWQHVIARTGEMINTANEYTDTKLSGKQDTITGAGSTITGSNLTTSRALVSNSNGKVAVSDVTSTELSYLDGVTSNVQTQLNNKAASNHAHSYAGSASAGGAATSANKLNTNAGSGTQPVYFTNGVPTPCSYTLGKTVPSDAKFTDTTYSAATNSTLGLVKSGTDITVDSSGNVSVNDNSHNHTSLSASDFTITHPTSTTSTMPTITLKNKDTVGIYIKPYGTTGNVTVPYIAFYGSENDDSVQLTNIAAPTDDLDAANKEYVDNKVSDVVTCSTAQNITGTKTFNTDITLTGLSGSGNESPSIKLTGYNTGNGIYMKARARDDGQGTLTLYNTSDNTTSVQLSGLATPASESDAVNLAYLKSVIGESNEKLLYYGTCSTTGSTAAKTVSCDSFQLYTGAHISIRFSYTNTATAPTLNVNSTGAKSIRYKNSTTISSQLIKQYRTYDFVYNGTQWDLIGEIIPYSLGSSAKPIFITGGELTACSSTIGSGVKPVYMSSGAITASSSTVGAETIDTRATDSAVNNVLNYITSSNGIFKPTFLSSGTITNNIKVQYGSSKITYKTSGSNSTVTVTFAEAFTRAPFVFVNQPFDNSNIIISAISATSVTFAISSEASTQVTRGFHWLAIGN